jgi:hypothetical protein
MAARSTGAALMALATSGIAWGAVAQDTLVRNLVIAADPQPFSADDLLWMEVDAGGVVLTDSMNVYASRSGVFVPLGEFSRVLDLAVGVFPGQRRAEGWVLDPTNRITVDLTTREAVVSGRSIRFSADQAAIYDDDLYLRIDLIEQLLPVKLKADASAQMLTVTTTRALPFEQRAERARRQAAAIGIDADVGVVRQPTPYRLFSPPAFDVNVGGQITRDGVDNAGRYDVRVGNDLLYGGFEGYVGSDDDGAINAVRVALTRKDPYGRALGTLGGTRAGIGDVFSPSMPIGASGVAGRGVYYSSAPLENLDLATPLNLRGELALGEEVELYVNEVLQRAQTSPTQGRYEFLDVPLAFGLNTIRLVFYGSQGQIREVVRRINFGSGQVETGRFVLHLSAVEQGLTVFNVGQPAASQGVGSLRLVATVDYGLTPGLTLSAGAARYDPQGRDSRTLAAAGVRSSLGPVAAQVDAALDDQGGRGLSVSLATRAYGVSLIGRHSEYGAGFIDETRQLGVLDQAPLSRASDLRADGQWTGPGGLVVPVSVNARRLARTDGATITTAELRASAPIGRYYASGNLAYEAETMIGARRQRWLGGFDINTLISARLQTRAGLTYELSPDPELETAYITADWQLSPSAALRFGAIRALGPQASTAIQASQLWRAPRFDLALNVAYETRRQDWRVGLQLGFGFGYDPGRDGYRITRPGVAGGGSVAVDAWIDDNGDGRRQADEAGVPGIVVDTNAGGVTTDADGYVYATGLGDMATARVRLTTEGIDDPFLLGGPTDIQIVPRPGQTARIDYPMQRSAEVQILALLSRGEAQPRPLAALAIELSPEAGGAPILGRSDHAGVLFFERVRPGVYDVRLDAAQAQALGVSLVEGARVVVPSEGGFVDAGRFYVRIDGEVRQ